jgi:hypothetical protein
MEKKYIGVFVEKVKSRFCRKSIKVFSFFMYACNNFFGWAAYNNIKTEYNFINLITSIQ